MNATSCTGVVRAVLMRFHAPTRGASAWAYKKVDQSCPCDLSGEEVERMVEAAGYRRH